MKKQIWLRPHELSVIAHALDYALSGIQHDLNGAANSIERMALRYTREQIAAVRPLFNAAEEAPNA